MRGHQTTALFIVFMAALISTYYLYPAKTTRIFEETTHRATEILLSLEGTLQNLSFGYSTQNTHTVAGTGVHTGTQIVQTPSTHNKPEQTTTSPCPHPSPSTPKTLSPTAMQSEQARPAHLPGECVLRTPNGTVIVKVPVPPRMNVTPPPIPRRYSVSPTP